MLPTLYGAAGLYALGASLPHPRENYEFPPNIYESILEFTRSVMNLDASLLTGLGVIPGVLHLQ